jgi:adenylate kinase
MRLLLIGPPGAGKGTQAVRIAEHFGIPHISSGELLRRHVADGTSIGRMVQEKMRRGDLVSDGIVMDILRKPVEAASRGGGYVLDGFPRTVDQAEAAYLVAKNLGASVQVALHLAVPREELVRRMLDRAKESGRADDTEEVINHRLAVFEERTMPLLDYYAQRERLVRVNGARPITEVTWSVIVQLQRIRRKVKG